MLRFGSVPSLGSWNTRRQGPRRRPGSHPRTSQVRVAPAEWALSCLQVETSVTHTMRPLFSDRRHLDASYTHPKSGLRAESAFPYPRSDAPLEAAGWAPRRERLPSPAPGHRKPAQATCWTLSGGPRSCAPKPAPRSAAPRVPYPSATEKFHSRLLLWLPFPLPITHIHSSLISQQSPLFNEARLASPRAPGCPRSPRAPRWLRISKRIR